MRNVILVLGMHRSGTSAAAGFLVKLGGAQPKTLMFADEGNERGYFESQALMTFHDELLASAGSSWTDWRQFNPAWYQSPTAAAFRKRAKQLFKEEFDGEPLAVLKDPRVCRFAPFWLKVLAGTNAQARVVIPVRAPLEVAFSMRKRNGFSLATGALLWLRHIIDAEIASRALPRSIFTWDQLLRDWRGVAEKASTELGLPWPRLSDATAHEIENFFGDDLVHHRVSAPELAAHPDIHEWTTSAYDAMLKLAREPRSSSALKTLDDIRDAFNRASRMFGRTVLEDEVRSQDLCSQRDAARAELAGALQAKEQISMELNARVREASDLAQALAEAGCQREQAELALAREKNLKVQLANDLEGRTAELADAVAAAKKVFTAERERRDGLTARIAEADTELARERSLCESLKATLAATESKLAEELTRAQQAESEQASIAGKLRQKAAEADARAEDASIKVLALEVKIAHLERDGERRERETAALLSSTSWRLSAPWRAYRRMVSRLRRLLHGKKMNPLFDREWYLQQYPDVRAGEMDPYEHYLRHGAAEGRDPNPLFDTDWYLEQNLDVRESGANPLVHFYLHGAAEGRDPHPQSSQLLNGNLHSAERQSCEAKSAIVYQPNIDDIAEHFDAEFYVGMYSDVASAKVNPVEHYFFNGWKEGRDPIHWFSTRYYLKANPDVAAAGINPFWHYVTAGRTEGRSPKQIISARRALLEYLMPPEETESGATVPDHDRITEAYLLEHFRTMTNNAGGLVLTFSNDCYLTVTGGTQLFIADEQKLFNAQRFAYMHLSPLVSSPFIKDFSPDESLTRIAINGELIGVAMVSEVARVLEGVSGTTPDNRILVMHSPMGQSIFGFLRIFAALEPTSTYYWLHDFSSVCTGYNLLRNNVEFCHAPPQDSMACSVCIYGSSRRHNARHLLKMFEVANFTVVAPSAVTQKIWLEASEFPRRAVVVQEHCSVDYSAGLHRDHRVAEQIGLPGHPVKVAFVGHPVMHKGWPVFERLVEETRSDSAYEFFHFAKRGVGVRSRRIRPIDAVATSDRRDAMVELLREHKIDIVVIPALWPETFSYVTFESLAAGCDLITLANSGNVAASVERTGRGRVFGNEDELVEFFAHHHAVEFVRSRAVQPNPCGSLLHRGTTAAIVFGTAH